MFDAWQLEFVQRGMVEVLLLGIACGLLGTQIVLRGLAFFSHAVGAAAFPGLVLADGLAFSPQLGAAGTAGLVAGTVGWLSRRDRDRDRQDSITALVLVGALAIGIVLASDVFHSGAHVETLLFGSLLLLDGSDIALAAAAAVATALATLVAGPRWLAIGFDPPSARGLGLRAALADAALLGLIAAVAIAMLSAIGALLATALLVVPAATARLFCSRVGRWQAASVALACAEGVAGLWASVELNAPPGATIAVLAGSVFALVAVVRIARARGAVVVAAAALLLGGCGAAAPAGGAVTVVATTTQLADLARAVGGDRVTVAQILRPASDPHDYEPRPADVIATAHASVVLESGAGLDPWMAKVVAQAGDSPRVVVVGDRLTPPATDPHWWHDPRAAAAATAVIRDVLVAAAPAADARSIRHNAANFLARVRVLDRGITRCVDSVPSGRRRLVTDHDAFGAFARRYAITVVGAVIPSQTTQAQPSAGALAALVRVIEREHVSAIFPENSVNPRLAEAVANETHASIGAALYGDTLGPAGSPGATYLSMEHHNADAMVRGFTQGARGCPISGI